MSEIVYTYFMEITQLSEQSVTWETAELDYFKHKIIALRPSSDAVLHMSRIEYKWEKSFVLPH